MKRSETNMALENKLGITSSPELAEAEERISKKKALELFENGVLDSLEAGTTASLKAIHSQLTKARKAKNDEFYTNAVGKRINAKP